MVSNNFIKLTSSNFIANEDIIPEAVLDEFDPVHDIQRLAGLSSANQGQLAEYAGYNSIQKTEVSNVSHTANEKIQYQNQHNIQAGTPEWFRLWFSLPYMTGENPW